MAALKAYVTGGTGFIGRRLVDRLLQEQWAVRALALESEASRLPPEDHLEVIVGDVTEPETLRGTMDGVDAVFHVAALVESWIRDPREYFRVNVEGTKNVIDEALRAGVPRFLFTSSLSGIGVTPGAVMREDSPPGKSFGPYEESKAEAERVVAKAALERSLPAITLIPGIVIGPGDTRNTGKFLLSYVRGEFPGTFAEDSLLPVVDVDDVVSAHLLAYRKGRVGERYIVSGENVSWGDLLRMSSAASGTPVPSRHVGGRALWLASRTGELFARVTRSPPRLPSWLADFLMTGAAMDNSKSIGELGMTYRPIADSIRDTIRWFREEGLLAPAQPRPWLGQPPLPVENPPVMSQPEPRSIRDESPSMDRTKERRPKPPSGEG